jgi:predicted porin
MENLAVKKCINYLFLLGILSFPLLGSADEEWQFYGAIKTSINTTNDGSDSNLSVSNNSTRVGLKGKKLLENNLKLIYQIEMGADTTERSKFDSGRNSFIGLEHQAGKFLVGQHDTPLKDVRAYGSELFNDTLAGARSMLSAVADDGGTKIDKRAKNAIMYYSPKMANTQVFLLYSTDDAKLPESPDNNDNELVGGSIMYREGGLYVGLGIEKASNMNAADTEAVRIATSYKFGAFQLGGVVETVDNGDNDSLTRDAGAINLRYNISQNTYAGIQYGMVTDYEGSTDTGGSNISLGVVHQLAKSTSIYAVTAFTNNEDNASFGLAQGGIQDTVVAAQPGDDVRGASVGIVHKF